MMRVGVVAYHNAIPLAWELDRFLPSVLVRDTPSVLTAKMEAGDLDLCLVPVAAVARHPEWAVAPNLGIASRGDVRSVRLISRSPREAIRHLQLDPASRTSNLLARLYWRESGGGPVEVSEGSASLEDRLAPGCAAVCIGDEALFYHDPAAVNVDLGRAWHDWTGLPFVYAVWAGPAGGDPKVHQGLEACWEENCRRLEGIIGRAVPDAGKRDTVLRYLEESICYRLGSDEGKGLNLFLDQARGAGWLPESPKVVCHG